MTRTELPQLVDVQVNGYGGVDFNADDLSPEALAAACERLEQDGIEFALATVITANVEQMKSRIRRIARIARESHIVGRVIRGIHVEGPFISGQAGYVGTHPVDAVVPASVELARQLVDAGDGLVRLVTLAPELDDQFATTRWLANEGILVAAGHCDPTLDELHGAIDQGLSMFTHLGNGCPLSLPRHDNVIQRVLSLSDRLWICFIADGVHVPFLALRNYLQIAGLDRAIVVSDAISAAGCSPGSYTLSGMQVVVDDHYATWSSDGMHLMGSACPLRVAFQNLIDQLGLSSEDAWRLTSANPRAVLGLA